MANGETDREDETPEGEREGAIERSEQTAAERFDDIYARELAEAEREAARIRELAVKATAKRVDVFNHLRITEPTPAPKVVDRLIRCIEDEPKRMWMCTWGEALTVDGSGQTITDVIGQALRRDMLPECGTVACEAGWLSVIIGGDLDTVQPSRVADLLTGSDFLREPHGTEERLRKIASKELYDEFYCHDLVHDRDQGTPEHAAKVVERLYKWRNRWVPLLETVTVEPIFPEPKRPYIPASSNEEVD